MQCPLCRATTTSHHRCTKANHVFPKWYKEQYKELCLQHACDADVAKHGGWLFPESLGKSPVLPGRQREDLAQQQPNLLTSSSNPQTRALLLQMDPLHSYQFSHTDSFSESRITLIQPKCLILLGWKVEHRALHEHGNLAAGISGQLK